MDRENKAREIIDSLNRGEIFELIKELEQEGSPIQISVDVRIDTPSGLRNVRKGSVGYVSACYGDFHGRPVQVKSLYDLDAKYVLDVNLLEGDWDSLDELKIRINNLNAFYRTPTEGSLAEKVYDMVSKEFDKEDLSIPLSGSLYTPHPEKKGYDDGGNRLSDQWGLPRQEVYSFLSSNGIEFLRCNMDARPDGIYDDRTKRRQWRMTFVDETKVADISLKLL